MIYSPSEGNSARVQRGVVSHAQWIIHRWLWVACPHPSSSPGNIPSPAASRPQWTPAGHCSQTDWTVASSFEANSELKPTNQMQAMKYDSKVFVDGFSPAILTRLKSSVVSLTAKSTWNGAICSRRISRCLISNNWASTSVFLDEIPWEAFERFAMQAESASCESPWKMALSRERYNLDKHRSVRRTLGYHMPWRSAGEP